MTSPKAETKNINALSRRSFLRITGQAAALTMLGSKASWARVVKGRTPNIIVILSDDQGWADVGISRQPLNPTSAHP